MTLKNVTAKSITLSTHAHLHANLVVARDLLLNNVTKKKNKMNVRVAFVLKFRKENTAFLWCTLLPSLKLRILCS